MMNITGTYPIREGIPEGEPGHQDIMDAEHALVGIR
jgi:hypothetical protein